MRSACSSPDTSHERPGRGHGSQGFKGHVRIYSGGIQRTMPEHFGDLRKRGATADHLCCQTMTEQMCGTSSGALDAGSRKCSANDVSHRGRTGEAAVGRVQAAEHTPALVFRVAHAEILGQRLPNIRYQRQWLDHTTLAANHDFPGPPMNVVKFEQNDLPGSQPESGEQQ